MYYSIKLSVINCKPDYLEELVTKGVDVNSGDSDQKWTALHIAATKG